MKSIRDRLQYHSQNLTDGQLPKWRHGRAWALGICWGWSLFHDTRLLSISARRWGFSIYLRWFGFYVGGRGEEWDRGRWELSWHHGTVAFEHPWMRQDGWDSTDPWWKKSWRWTPMDTLFGRWRCTTEREPLPDVFIPMPEGCYRAKATRETRTWRRRFGIRKRRTDIWLEIPRGGIPHSGKGENSWDCGDDGLCGTGGATVEDAIANAVRSVLRSRARHGHDSKRTGSVPASICNEVAT